MNVSFIRNEKGSNMDRFLAAKAVIILERAINTEIKARAELAERVTKLEETIKEGDEDIKVALEALEGISKAQEATRATLKELGARLDGRDSAAKSILRGN